MKKTLLATLALLAALPAFAGRPLSTEDAATLGDKACQLETWVDRTRGNVTDLNVVPACSTFDTEFQFGAIRSREAGLTSTTGTFFQAKYAFKSIDDGPWGVGLVLGAARSLNREEKNNWGDPYLIVPVSFGFGEDKDSRLLVHLNIGATRARDESRNLTLWGVAFEKPLTEKFTVLGEVYGENAKNPYIRFGGRYTLFDKFDVDLTYVTRSGGVKEDRFFSVGFHLETDPFLP